MFLFDHFFAYESLFYLPKGSWETAFKNRFKNLRKTGQKGEGTSAVRCPSKGKGENEEPRPKKRRIEEILEMPEGETAETCQEHIKAMKKEMDRSSNRNLAMVKELMELTHSYRRQWFLKEMVPISSFIGEYPALKTPFGVSFYLFYFTLSAFEGEGRRR